MLKIMLIAVVSDEKCEAKFEEASGGRYAITFPRDGRTALSALAEIDDAFEMTADRVASHVEPALISIKEGLQKILSSR